MYTQAKVLPVQCLEVNGLICALPAHGRNQPMPDPVIIHQVPYACVAPVIHAVLPLRWQTLSYQILQAIESLPWIQNKYLLAKLRTYCRCLSHVLWCYNAHIPSFRSWLAHDPDQSISSVRLQWSCTWMSSNLDAPMWNWKIMPCSKSSTARQCRSWMSYLGSLLLAERAWYWFRTTSSGERSL